MFIYVLICSYTKRGDTVEREMFSIKETAQMLGFTDRAVRQWVLDGKIKATKIFSEWRITREEIERLKKGE